MQTEYGKITSFDLGFLCGCSEDLFGVRITFEGAAWACGAELILSRGGLRTPNGEVFVGVATKLEQIMRDAKATLITQMIGKPVAVTFEKGTLHDWRIFTEVL